MYDRILIPVDGSPYSEEVIDYALLLAEATRAKLTFLRVAESESKKQEAANYVRSLASEFDAEGLALAHNGELADDILAEARSVPNTLITITTHGRGGLLTMILGSVARKIVLASDTPVLVYRPKGSADNREPTDITTVLLPLDGTDLSESMGAQAATLARALDVSLTVVQVLPTATRMHPLTPASDVLEGSYISHYTKGVAREFGIPVDWEVLHGDPVNSISTFVEDRPGVLAVMATRGRGALQSAVLGSVTSGLVHKSGMPIILHAPRGISSVTV
jgi:nucleotide-binding universal stress UspA family protein